MPLSLKPRVKVAASRQATQSKRYLEVIYGHAKVRETTPRHKDNLQSTSVTTTQPVEDGRTQLIGPIVDYICIQTDFGRHQTRAAGETSRSHMILKPMELCAISRSSSSSSSSSVDARIVPGCTTVYGCPLAYEALLLQISFNLEEPSDAGCASFSLVSRIDSN